MPPLEKIARVIGENMPSPYALDDVWRQTANGPVFDLSHAQPDSKAEWLALAAAVLEVCR